MRQTPVITSISKGKATSIDVKFAEPYVCLRTVKQTKEDKTGIRRQAKDDQRWLNPHPAYKKFDDLETRDLGVLGRNNVKKGALSKFFIQIINIEI